MPDTDLHTECDNLRKEWEQVTADWSRKGRIMNQMPIITLSTGLRVGNLNIPHSLKFTDDNVIASCGPERTKAGRPKLWEHLADETTLAEVRARVDPDARFPAWK